jgi:signal transduction histidine kinase
VLDAVRGPEGTIVDWRYCDANANWIRSLGRPRERLVATLAHELRNPLAPIRDAHRPSGRNLSASPG